MTRLADLLARSRWPLLVLPVVVSVFLLRSSGDGAVPVIATAIFGLVLLALVGVLIANLSGRDPDAEQRAAGLDSDPAAVALLARWLQRSKHFRFVGGTAGFIIGFSFVDGNLMTLVLSVLAGIALGGALAEAHSLFRRPARTASADIIIRDPGQYTDRGDTLAMAAIAIMAFALSVFAALSDSTSARSALLAGVTALAVILTTLLFQRVVVTRRRPALPERLRRADDLMRRLAATLGFTKPAIALALGLLAQSVYWLGSSGLNAVGAVLLWAAAFGWYVSSRQSTKNLVAEVRT